LTSTTKQAFRAVLTVCALSVASTAALSFAPNHAEAQAAASSASREEVEASPKGMIGLGLVGAEIGLVLPAAFGLTDLWAMIAFPIVGAAGGAAAGYFLIDDGGSGEAGLAAMTAGMVLMIPAMVLAASMGRYDPESDKASLSKQMLAQMTPDQRARAQAGPGLLRVSDRGLMLAAPGVEVAAAKHEGRSERRVKVAMLSGSF